MDHTKTINPMTVNFTPTELIVQQIGSFYITKNTRDEIDYYQLVRKVEMLSYEPPFPVLIISSILSCFFVKVIIIRGSNDLTYDIR